MEGEFFTGKGFISAGFLNLTPREAYTEAMEHQAVIVDVRDMNLTGFRQFDIPEVLFVPLSVIIQNPESVPRDKPIILADSTGLRSHDAMDILIKAGYTNIANLAGGLVEWERDGMPVLKNKSEQLDGSCICQLKPGRKG